MLVAAPAQHRPFSTLARVLTRAAGPPALLRAAPPFAALLLFVAVIFGGNGMRPRDLCAVAASSVAVRAALWAAWLLVTAPAARALLETPSTFFLRALPVPPWQFWVGPRATSSRSRRHVDAPLRDRRRPAGRARLQGIAAAAAAAAMVVARPARGGEIEARAGAGAGHRGRGAASAPLARRRRRGRRGRRSPPGRERPSGARGPGPPSCAGSAPVALALAHAAVLVRRDPVATAPRRGGGPGGGRRPGARPAQQRRRRSGHAGEAGARGRRDPPLAGDGRRGGEAAIAAWLIAAWLGAAADRCPILLAAAAPLGRHPPPPRPARAGAPLRAAAPHPLDRPVKRLVIEDVRKLLGGRPALDGVSITWDRPGTLVVFGENGAGKSTLLRVVAGVLAADAGEVSLFGHRLSTDRLAALRHVGYAPEAADLPPQLGVGELAAHPRRRPQGRAPPSPGARRGPPRPLAPSSASASARSRSGSGAGPGSWRRWWAIRTCSCSTSPPTASTPPGLPCWLACSPSARRRVGARWWRRTTGRSSSGWRRRRWRSGRGGRCSR